MPFGPVALRELLTSGRKRRYFALRLIFGTALLSTIFTSFGRRFDGNMFGEQAIGVNQRNAFAREIVETIVLPGLDRLISNDMDYLQSLIFFRDSEKHRPAAAQPKRDRSTWGGLTPRGDVQNRLLDAAVRIPPPFEVIRIAAPMGARQATLLGWIRIRRRRTNAPTVPSRSRPRLDGSGTARTVIDAFPPAMSGSSAIGFGPPVTLSLKAVEKSPASKLVTCPGTLPAVNRNVPSKTR